MRCWNHGVSVSAPLPSRVFTGDEESCQVTDASLLRFDGQVAIVTGAGGGLGRAIAAELASRGARVLVNDYGGDTFGKPGSTVRAEQVAEEFRALGWDAVASGISVGTAGAARDIASAALEAFGRIDILVNNAGIALPGLLTDFSDDDIETVFRTNLLGPYALVRAVWPYMREQRYGRVLNVSSNSAFGIGANAPYSTTKAGLLGLTMDAAIEGKPHGILVNAIMPTAYTRLIEQIPDAAFVQWFRQFFPAQKAANSALYLLSGASTLTGHIWAVGGGRAARVVFAEGRGWVDADADPAAIERHLAEINSMQEAVFLSAQAESMAILGGIFHADGRAQPGLGLESVIGASKGKR